MMRRSLKNSLQLLSAAVLLATPALGQEIFRDDFNGGSIDLAKWDVMTHVVGRSRFGNTPVVSNGFARLRHDTYNPTAPGSTFRGTELATDAFFSRGANGIELEARVRSNAMVNGLVTSFFTYISRNVGGTILWDEADFEFLSTRTNATPVGDPVLVSTYNDFNLTTQPYGDEVTQSSREYIIPTLDLTQFNSFRMRWLNNRLEWYANGRLLRTVTGTLVPTDATRPRFNFWAPGSEWGAAYSSALQPTSNPANNQSAFYDVDWMVIRNARPAVTATSPDRVFTDRFNNASVPNADSINGFWTQRSQGNSSVNESTAEPLKLNAGGGGYPHAQIVSAVRSEFNMFESPIEIEATGIDFVSSSNSYNKALLRFSLSSEGLTTNSQSEYTSEDALALRIDANQTISLGYKVNAPNTNTEFEGTNVLTQSVSGPVRRVNLIVNPTFYTLKVEHDLSLEDGTPVTAEFSGSLNINLNDWRKLAAAATGHSALYVQSQLSNAAPNETATAFVESLAVNAIKPTWNQATGGDWNSTAGWSRHMVPNYSGANAIFGTAITGTQTVVVNAPVTAGRITFDSNAGYVIAGSSSITLQSPAASARVLALNGSHQIAVPVHAVMNTELSVATGASLDLAGGLMSSATATKSGDGALQLRHIRGTSFSIDAGTVRIAAGATANAAGGASSLQSLAFAGGAVPLTSLDLTNNALVLDYSGASPAESVRLLLLAGSSSGTGLVSSMANESFRLGFAEGAAIRPGGGEFAGQAVDATSIVVAFTSAGDTNLDGTVNLDDFTALASSFGASGLWSAGDFSYDGQVNLDDFTQLAANFGTTLASAPRASVPEPAGAMVIVLLAATRRRRA
ncbi:MAG TPA: family 16 glycosylhydrolase [Tepidisphaeraceae bacterium]|nr:family 16 glycosylhydrolase [Tepidisphaeraceae bacterium]